MFTGIVEQVGQVALASSQTLRLIAKEVEDDPWRIGESVAVNGCCLTLADRNPYLVFEMSEETLRRTNLGELKAGMNVNLERAVRTDARLGGHFVQGHVDAIGILEGVEKSTNAHVLRFSYPTKYSRYLLDKGSIAIDGISLTAVEPTEVRFKVWIVPHTWVNTTLPSMVSGQRVNLEFDMLAKYVEKLLDRG